MRALAAAVLLLATLAGQTWAADKANPSDKGKSGGFTALALIVVGDNWKAEWNTSTETVPHIQTVDALKPSELGTILTFFSGATLKDGNAQLTCAVTIREADGKKTSFPDQLCFDNKLPGPVDSVYMTGLELAFAPAATDTAGLVYIDLGITDVHGGRRVQLSVSVYADTGVSKS